MGAIEYSLFRAKFVKSGQRPLFRLDLAPSQILIRAIQEKPSLEVREGYLWHIGNVRQFSDDTGYFAVGRTTKATIEKFDAESRNFTEEELETSPYTHCIFNAQIGLIGIARKNSLARTTKGIAARIQQLFSSSGVVNETGVLVEISPIPDPEGFINALDSAFEVTKFTATFGGPNPIDADAIFQKPLSVYLSSVNGRKGKTQVQGEDLNRDALKAVTRSVAGTGNEASARIKKTRKEKPITINLKGDPIKRRYDEDVHEPEVVVKDLTNEYYRVRRNEGNQAQLS